MQKPNEVHEIKQLDNTKFIFILKGIAIGFLAGFVVSLFRLAIEKGLALSTQAYGFIKLHPTWVTVAIAAAILLTGITGYLIKTEPDIKGSGIPQVEGQLQGELQQRWLPALWKKFIGGILSAGPGLFLGREGPSIQLGALVGQGFAEKTKTTQSEKKIFISSGAAAGLSAAFNAPIAGLLFVVEEVHHTFSPLVWLTSLTSAIVANFVSLYFFGLRPVLYIGALKTLPLNAYGWLILLGIVLGVLGRFYQIVLLSLNSWYQKTHLPSYCYGIIPFLLLIPIGIFFPQLLGGGNQLIISIGQTQFSLLVLAGFFLLRFVFSMISYGSGLPGGIFLPILTLGAVIGALFATLLSSLGLLDPAYVKNFAILAMAGYFTAIGKAPLTAIILVTEMVGSITHLMPLGVISLVAYVVNDILGGNPIYESLLERLLGKKLHNISGHKTIIELPVTAESRLDGLMVRDFEWPQEMILVSLRRGQNEILTHGDTIMKMGDTLMILTDERLARIIKEKIQKAARL